VSSDPFADLAQTLAIFADGLRALLDTNKVQSPGSPAAKEASQETYAGDWGDNPSRDSFAPVLLTSFSRADMVPRWPVPGRCDDQRLRQSGRCAQGGAFDLAY
jgi:hypothetical protein